MISWLKRSVKRALNKLLLRPTIHKTGVDVRALGGKVDMLLSAGKAGEASIREIRAALGILSRETGEQHEALADRFLESTIDTSKAIEALRREMGERQEALVERVVETKQALDTLQVGVGRLLEALHSRPNGSDDEILQALKSLTHLVEEQRDVLIGRVAESTGEHRQAIDALTETLSRQHAVLVGKVIESAGETRHGMEAAITKSGASFQARIATFVRKIEALERMSFRQHEALAALTRVLGTQHPLPPTRGWAASPDLLLYLYELTLEKKPDVIVELGSGVSTLVMAAALKTNGKGRLYSFDHDAEYATRTAGLLARESFGDVATVEHAPLSPWHPPAPTGLAESWNWYTLPEAVAALPGIDLLVVDGPPESTGAYARYPALPALIDRLAPGATVLLDDTIREADTKIAEAWRDEHGLDLALRTDFEKGLAVLTLKPAAATKELGR